MNRYVEGLFQPIPKTRLSHEARRQILERISDGRLPAASRVSELALSRQLGISRTPLHEAMVVLARDGLVENLGRRGWLITPLHEADARELYPVLGALEGLALATAEDAILAVLDDLRALLPGIEERSLPVMERLRAEAEWHGVLLGSCPNKTLVDVSEGLIVRATRFETACARQGWRRIGGELASVVECLTRGATRQAARSLEMHWRDRGEAVARWIRQRRASSDQEAPTPRVA